MYIYIYMYEIYDAFSCLHKYVEMHKFEMYTDIRRWIFCRNVVAASNCWRSGVFLLHLWTHQLNNSIRGDRTSKTRTPGSFFMPWPSWSPLDWNLCSCLRVAHRICNPRVGLQFHVGLTKHKDPLKSDSKEFSTAFDALKTFCIQSFVSSASLYAGNSCEAVSHIQRGM